MRKKDYELIATVLRTQANIQYNIRGHHFIVDSVSRMMAEALKQENFRFDIDKFLEDCGISNSVHRFEGDDCTDCDAKNY